MFLRQELAQILPMPTATYQAHLANLRWPVYSIKDEVVYARSEVAATRLHFFQEPEAVFIRVMYLEDAYNMVGLTTFPGYEQRSKENSVTLVMFRGDIQVVSPMAALNPDPSAFRPGCAFVIIDHDRRDGSVVGAAACPEEVLNEADWKLLGWVDDGFIGVVFIFLLIPIILQTWLVLGPRLRQKPFDNILAQVNSSVKPGDERDQAFQALQEAGACYSIKGTESSDGILYDYFYFGSQTDGETKRIVIRSQLRNSRYIVDLIKSDRPIAELIGDKNGKLD